LISFVSSSFVAIPAVLIHQERGTGGVWHAESGSAVAGHENTKSRNPLISFESSSFVAIPAVLIHQERGTGGVWHAKSGSVVAGHENTKPRNPLVSFVSSSFVAILALPIHREQGTIERFAFRCSAALFLLRSRWIRASYGGRAEARRARRRAGPRRSRG